MKNRKLTLGIILTLLLIFLPITIFSTTMHIKLSKPVDENPNKQFKINNKLYFYNDSKELLGTYTCEHPDGYCDYAVFKNEFTTSLYEYQPESLTKTSLINNTFAFIMDCETTKIGEAPIILYDVLNSRAYQKYSEVKNYGIGIENNYYIVKSIDKETWGLIQVSNDIKEKISPKYDYIGLSNTLNKNNKIESSRFAVLENNNWKLVDSDGKDLTTTYDKDIVSYDDKYIVLTDENQMYLMDYNGISYLNGSYKHISFYNKYLKIVDSSNNFYLYDLDKKEAVTSVRKIDNIDDVKLTTENNLIRIFVNNALVENVEID